MLFGLLPEFPFAPEVTRDLRKSGSSLLNHIFSTVPAIALSSTQNWVYSHSGCLGGDAEKIYIRAQSSFSEFLDIWISLMDNRVPQNGYDVHAGSYQNTY